MSEQSEPASRKPEVFIAEPVGSCTDLVATVTLPLERIYQKGFVMAPYAVLLDPFRAERVLGIAGGGVMSAELLVRTPVSGKGNGKKGKLLAAKAAEKKAEALSGVASSKGGEPAKARKKEEARQIAAIQAEMDQVIGTIGALRSEGGWEAGGRSGTGTFSDKGTTATGGGFSDDVNYIYRKQLEEAEIIVINKIDLMSAERRQRLRAALAVAYPEARLMEIASRHGHNMEPLFEALTTETGKPLRVMDVDYTRYGVGEARLGWLNIQTTVTVGIPVNKGPSRSTAAKKSAKAPIPEIDGNLWLETLAQEVQKRLREKEIEVAHFKMTLRAGKDSSVAQKKNTKARNHLAALNLVRSDAPVEFSRRLEVPFTQGELLLNLRAEADPDILAALVDESLDMAAMKKPSLTYNNTKRQHFRPGQPNPAHRVNALSTEALRTKRQ